VLGLAARERVRERYEAARIVALAAAHYPGLVRRGAAPQAAPLLADSPALHPAG
jgi:hypothetical protein